MAAIANGRKDRLTLLPSTSRFPGGTQRRRKLCSVLYTPREAPRAKCIIRLIRKIAKKM